LELQQLLAVALVEEILGQVVLADLVAVVVLVLKELALLEELEYRGRELMEVVAPQRLVAQAVVVAQLALVLVGL
jgi:hypothetical protein